MISEEIAKGESNILEFKQDITKDPLKYVKTAIAFANSQGGRLIFGVDDRREIVGLSGDLYRKMDSIVDTITSMSEPRINVDSYIETVEDRQLIIIEINPGRARPYHLKDRSIETTSFVRVSAITKTADEETLRELVMDGMNTSFDRLAYAGEIIKDPDERVGRIAETLSKKKGRTFSSADIENMGFILEKDGAKVPSRALMLLTDNPFLQARIQCARFRGTQKSEFIDRKEYAGPLDEQIEKATNFVLEHIDYGARIESLYRDDRYEVPPSAVREVICNAVLHRSYSIEGSPIFVAVYDDRIVVTSPGSLPSGLRMDQVIEGRSRARNPILARYFKEIGMVEGWGGGIMRVMTECTSYGLQTPSISDFDGYIDFTIYRAGYGEGEIILDTPLTENEKKVIQCMRENPKCGVRDISARSDISTATVNRIIRSLKSRNILKRIGAKKNGSWALMI